MQALAFIGANGEHAVPRFASGFGVLKLWANLFARRGGFPPISRGGVNQAGSSGKVSKTRTTTVVFMGI